MNRKRVKHDQTKKRKPRGIPVSDAGLNAFEETVKIAAKTEPRLNDRLPYILRYIAMEREYIAESDARRAVMTQAFLDYELYTCNFLVSSRLQRRRGRPKSKEIQTTRMRKIWEEHCKGHALGDYETSRRIYEGMKEAYGDSPQPITISRHYLGEIKRWTKNREPFLPDNN